MYPAVNRCTAQESQMDALNCEIKELQYEDKVNNGLVYYNFEGGINLTLFIWSSNLNIFIL